MQTNSKNNIFTSNNLFLLCLLLIAIFIFFGHSFLPNTVIFGWDTVHEKYYWRQWGFNQFINGDMPWWNPHILSGYPFSADPIQALFYPLNLIHLFFKSHTAINITIILHILMAGIFSFRLLKYLGCLNHTAFFGAITFIFNGFILGRIFLGSLPHLCVISWMPLFIHLSLKILFNFDFRIILKNSLVCGMMILAGHPQFAFNTLLSSSIIVLVLCFFNFNIQESLKKLFFYSLSIVFGFLLSSVQTFQTFTLFLSGQRSSSGVSWYESKLASMWPADLLTFLYPDIYGDGVNTLFWGNLTQSFTVAYSGIVSLVFLIFILFFIIFFPSKIKKENIQYKSDIKKNRLKFKVTYSNNASISYYNPGIIAALCSILFFGLIMSMGESTFFYQLFYKYIPGFKYFRFAARYLQVFIFALSILSAIGFDIFSRTIHNKVNALFLIDFITFSLVLLTGSILTLLYISPETGILFYKFVLSAGYHLLPYELYNNPQFIRQLQIQIKYSLEDASIKLLILLVIFLFIHFYRKKLNTNYLKYFFWFIILVAFFDLYSFGTKYIIPYDISLLKEDKNLVNYLKKDKSFYRLATKIPSQYQTLPSKILNEFGHINYYSQSHLHRWMNYGISNIGGALMGLNPNYMKMLLENDTFEFEFPDNSYLLELLNTKYMIVPNNNKPSFSNYKLALSNKKLSLYENLNFKKRVVFIKNAIHINDEEALKILKNKSIDILKTVMISSYEIDVNKDYHPKEKLNISEIENSTNPVITSYSNNKVEVEITCSESGYLVLHDIYYPGWEVYVNNYKKTLLRAQYVFRAVHLEKGSNSIVFKYSPKPLKWGIIVSIATLILVILLFILGKKRHFRQN